MITKSSIMLNIVIMCIKCNDYLGQFNDPMWRKEWKNCCNTDQKSSDLTCDETLNVPPQKESKADVSNCLELINI